jgi:hypothetical protein
MGVLERDSQSPILFSLTIYNIVEYVKHKGHKEIEEKIELLLFADGMIIIVDNNHPIDMQEKVNALHNYCTKNKF